METIKMKLNSPITDEQWNIITDAELERSDEIEFTTPSGKKVMYAKIKHEKRILNMKTNEIIIDGNVYRYVDEAPTIDAEPVRHGKWLFEEYPDGYYHSKCSLCNSWFSEDAFLNPYKYCPNCGACMIKQGDITTEQGDITTKRLDIPTMDEVNDEAN